MIAKIRELVFLANIYFDYFNGIEMSGRFEVILNIKRKKNNWNSWL